jgi:cysteine synthase
MTREVARKEGIFAGNSTGSAIGRCTANER